MRMRLDLTFLGKAILGSYKHSGRSGGVGGGYSKIGILWDHREVIGFNRAEDKEIHDGRV